MYLRERERELYLERERERELYLFIFLDTFFLERQLAQIPNDPILITATLRWWPVVLGLCELQVFKPSLRSRS